MTETKISDVQIQASAYSPDDVEVGIVHIGLGAFVRAHIAVYLEQLLNTQPQPWGICAANIRSNKTIVDQLNKQNNQYTVAEYASADAVTLRQVSSVHEVLFAGGDQVNRLLTRLRDPAIKIVTLTVTEKGYFFDAAQMQLKADSPAIRLDLENPEQPGTVPGILVSALKYRRQQGMPAFAVLSCDNMPHNGEVTKAAVVQLAARQDAALADWIEQEVAFPSSMVDRIVPAVTEQTITEVNQCLAQAGAPWVAQLPNGVDAAPIACEAFCQWVIEDHFPMGRPDFSAVGVELVEAVAPWEEMKLRMLNGSHSLMAYLGFLAGHETVADCTADPVLAELVRHYMLHEAAPTLNMPDSVDLRGYANALIERFGNASLRHKTLQIAMDGSQKIPQRWLNGAKVLLSKGQLPLMTALGLAGWIYFLQGDGQTSPVAADERYQVNDPLADELIALARATEGRESVKTFISQPLFGAYGLDQYKAFVDLVTDALQHMHQLGVSEALHYYTAQTLSHGDT